MSTLTALSDQTRTSTSNSDCIIAFKTPCNHRLSPIGYHLGNRLTFNGFYEATQVFHACLHSTTYCTSIRLIKIILVLVLSYLGHFNDHIFGILQPRIRINDPKNCVILSETFFFSVSGRTVARVLTERTDVCNQYPGKPLVGRTSINGQSGRRLECKLCYLRTRVNATSSNGVYWIVPHSTSKAFGLAEADQLPKGSKAILRWKRGHLKGQEDTTVNKRRSETGKTASPPGSTPSRLWDLMKPRTKHHAYCSDIGQCNRYLILCVCIVDLSLDCSGKGFSNGKN